jgi:WD40 repeat protein
VNDVAFLPDDKRIISSAMDDTFRIWDISAVIEGKEFDIEVDPGLPAIMGSWFRHVIPLGGWYQHEPFVFKHRFKVAGGIPTLNWNISSEAESGVDVLEGARPPEDTPEAAHDSESWS